MMVLLFFFFMTITFMNVILVISLLLFQLQSAEFVPGPGRCQAHLRRSTAVEVKARNFGWAPKLT